MSDYSFKIEEIQNPGMAPEVPAPYNGILFKTTKYHTPITPKENVLRLYRNEKPLWMPSIYFDINFIQPLVMPDAYARCKGGIDWFGIDWELEPLTNAAMVRPGTRRLEEITDWEQLEFPDLSAIDWQKDYEENYKDKLDPDKATMFVIVNGLFERTADLTSFEDTFCYLLEEEEALEAFYTKVTDFHIELMKIAKEVYHADIITFHDDMGTQKSSFFSPATFEEVMLPHYKRMNDAAHEMGLYVNFHSCGCVGNQIENFIAAGFDSWEGQDACNDKLGILDKHSAELAQVSSFSPDPEGKMTEEEYIQAVKDRVNDYGKQGRYIAWYRENNDERRNKGYEVMYTESRKLYCD